MATSTTTTTSHHNHHHIHHHHNRHLQKPTDLEITILSAKNLKNVNWRNGDLHPYAIFWIDPNHRLSTKSDDSNSTKPIWNENFLLPLPSNSTPFPSLTLTLQIFHYSTKPSSDTTPKPLVGTLRLPLSDLPDPHNPTRTRTFDLRRPSGRPNGKIRLKLALRERALPDYQNYQNAPQQPPPRALPDYQNAPQQQPPPRALPDYQNYQNTPQQPFYYASPSPPSYGRFPSSLPSHQYHNVPQSDPYPVYYPQQGGGGGGYYSAPASPAAIDRRMSYASVGGGGVGPSAPVDYDEKGRNGGKVGSGSGLTFGANMNTNTGGGAAGLAIDEGLRYEDGRVGGERVEGDVKKADEYVYYRRVDY